MVSMLKDRWMDEIFNHGISGLTMAILKALGYQRLWFLVLSFFPRRRMGPILIIEVTNFLFLHSKWRMLQVSLSLPVYSSKGGDCRWLVIIVRIRALHLPHLSCLILVCDLCFSIRLISLREHISLTVYLLFVLLFFRLEFVLTLLRVLGSLSLWAAAVVSGDTLTHL